MNFPTSTRQRWLIRGRARMTATAGALMVTAIIPWLGGCGKPPAAGGPPQDMAMPVIAATVRSDALEERLPLVGTLRARDEVTLVSEVDARIEKIGFKEGEMAPAGELLFEMDSRQRRARVAEVEARFNLAGQELERGRELLERQTIPPQEFDRLRATFLAAEAELAGLRADLEDTRVLAPFEGVMTQRNASVGQFVTRGTELGGLIQMDPLEIEFQVPERFARQVGTGQTIRLRTVAYPGEVFEGVVSYVAPRIDPSSRTLGAKARLGNEDGRLRPGQFGAIDLVVRSSESALLVPESAVRYQGERVFVTKVDEERVVAFQPVKPGLRMEGEIEIAEGLREGDVVVVEGFQKLGPGSKVTFAPGSAEYGVEPDEPAAPDPEDRAGDGDPEGAEDEDEPTDSEPRA